MLRAEEKRPAGDAAWVDLAPDDFAGLGLVEPTHPRSSVQANAPLAPTKPTLKEELSRLVEDRLGEAEAEWEAQSEQMAMDIMSLRAQNADLERRLEGARLDAQEAQARAADAELKLAALADVKRILDRAGY
ncbi:MAG: hypothetical protein ACYDCK_01995 [Thermoplasmatota archaeon]